MLWTDLVQCLIVFILCTLIMLESDHVLNEALFDNIAVVLCK